MHENISQELDEFEYTSSKIVSLIRNEHSEKVFYHTIHIQIIKQSVVNNILKKVNYIHTLFNL